MHFRYVNSWFNHFESRKKSVNKLWAHNISIRPYSVDKISTMRNLSNVQLTTSYFSNVSWMRTILGRSSTNCSRRWNCRKTKSAIFSPKSELISIKFKENLLEWQKWFAVFMNGSNTAILSTCGAHVSDNRTQQSVSIHLSFIHFFVFAANIHPEQIAGICAICACIGP